MSTNDTTGAAGPVPVAFRASSAFASDSAAVPHRDHAQEYFKRGLTLLGQGQTGAALASFERALEIFPHYPEAHVNRGIVQYMSGQLEAALRSFELAISIRPDFVEAHQNRAIILALQHRLTDSLQSYSCALEGYDRRRGGASAPGPDEAMTRYSRSFVLLLAGDFDNGWKEHEWRRNIPRLSYQHRRFPQPYWLGDEPVLGKTLLLYAEQGLGDTIQFCRYVPVLAQRGARVLLEVEPALREIMLTLPGVSQVLTREDALPEFHHYCSLMSLPRAMRTSLATIPAEVPYLRANADAVRIWRERLGHPHRPRVGVVWSGGQGQGARVVPAGRNIPLSKLDILRDLDVEFISLQKGEPAESEYLTVMSSNWKGPHIASFVSMLSNFADTAALMENLDLVISVDTSTAHLAGALGRPVWMLNRFDTEWRWLLDRSDSPWYPTMRIYRQQRYGDWDGVLARLRGDLEHWAANHRAY